MRSKSAFLDIRCFTEPRDTVRLDDGQCTWPQR
jgi:hypothetical protein